MLKVQPTETIHSSEDIHESTELSDEEMEATLSDIEYYSDHPGELVYYSDMDELFGHLRHLLHN